MISFRKAYHAKGVRLSALLLSLLLSLASLASCGQSTPPLLESLKLGIPAAALQSPVQGPLPDATELRVGISFKIDPQVLNLVGQQPLRPEQPSDLEQFAKRLGISDDTYLKIASFFNVGGLVLKLSKLRTYLTLQAKAGTVARLLYTRFVIYLYKSRTFYAPATPPKVPSFLAAMIDAISGLDSYSTQPRHALYIHDQGSHVSRHGALDCSPASQTLATADVAGAYGYNALWQRGLHGENMTINLVELDGLTQDDIQHYLSCVHFQGHLSFVNVDGGPSDAEGESTLDVQMAAGLAPAASLNVYQTDGNAFDDTWTQVNDELQQIVDTNTNNASAGSVVSISLGVDEADMSSNDVSALDSSLRQLTQAEHMTVFAASGDCGAFADELSVDSLHNRAQEVVWSDGLDPFSCNNSWGSGGGNSSMYARPAWQKANGVTNHFAQNDRQVPDVSAVADHLAVYFQGEWGAAGGTSAAAPIWAAAQALVNEDTIQRLSSFAYSPQFYYAVADKNGGGNAYFDVTSGDNLYYPATPGWDYATGLGTPNLASFDMAVYNILA